MTGRYERYGALSPVVDGGVLTLTIDSPPLNAMTPECHRELTQVWADAGADPAVRCIILTGAGDRAFSAGGNLQAMIDRWGDHGRWQIGISEGRAIIVEILACPKPIIARINGHAMGVAASIALACDISIVVDEAKIGDPHVNVGLTAGDGGALLWPHLVGLVEARRHLLSGEPLTGREAAAKGLVTASVSRELLDSEVGAWVDKLLSKAPLAVQTTKQALNLGILDDARRYLGEMLRLETRAWESTDHLEAVRALLDKRAPVFTGE